MKRIIFFSALLALSFASCRYLNRERIRGNGNIRTEQRTPGDFSGVEVRGAIDLIVRTDSARQVSVEADENLLEYVEVRRKGNNLVVTTRDGFNIDATRSIVVRVSGPIFDVLEASGACSISSDAPLQSSGPLNIHLSGASRGKISARCPSITAEVSGASKLNLAGETKDLAIEAHGSSRVEAFELLTEEARVDLSGASHAEVFTSVKLNVEASGASGVRYRGPGTVNSELSGASSAKKAD